MTRAELLDLLLWLLPMVPLLFVIACAIVVFGRDWQKRRKKP